MEIEILEYIDNPKGFRKGIVDIKVVYSIEKSETFRGLGYFEKENRKWINFPNTKRGDNWLPYYERNPEVNKDILIQALKALEVHFGNSFSKPKEDEDFYAF